jgi:hypothetical protein
LNSYDVVIIGGGAAGLMCAITAGQRGRKVLVLEKSNKVGKKILMSGGGRCNFTNMTIASNNFLSANRHFCKSALSQYTQWDFIALVEKHGIAYHERSHGQLFCDDSSKAVLRMLLDECAEVGVTITTQCDVIAIKQQDDQNQENPDHNDQSSFYIETADRKYHTKSLVIATGGLSIPSLGGSGYGYDLAQNFKMDTKPLRAGLVPFTFTDAFHDITERLSGLSINARISTGDQSFAEAVLFTHRGLSGPAVLQLSNYWREGMSIEIDMMPDMDAFELIKSFKKTHPKSRLRTLLTQHLPKSLVQEIEALWWPKHADTAIAEMSGQLLQEIINQIHGWVVKPAGTEGYRTAEVTLGGVSCDELSSKTMESKTLPGLYFIGEVVDVTGHLGGFNFQWAWASGYVAGQVA